MKRIMTVIAVMAAVLSSCSKSEPESGIRNANITLNISVSNPSNSSKALIKSDWAVGDRILIWYDGNTQAEPDMAIKYDGSKWNNDTDVEVSGNAPAESGCLKALYDGAVKVTAKDGYTYSGGALTARLQTWTFLTEIQVVVTGISGSENYSLSCDKFTPCTGYSVGAGEITASQGNMDGFVTGQSNADGVVFVFASADYSAGSFELTIKDRTSGGLVIKSYIVSNPIEKNVSRIKAVKTAFTKYEVRDYVRIAGLKWAKENLAITSSGHKEFKQTGHVNGDYFQWGTHKGFCGNSSDSDKGLLIYSSFASRMCGDGSSNFSFKSGKNFDTPCAPYYNGQTYTDYVTAGRSVLEPQDDVASIVLGNDWRMPTTGEFLNLYNAATWTWSSDNCGFYLTEKGIALNPDKSNALLFFPAAGYGSGSSFESAGIGGNYWSSSLCIPHTDNAHYLDLPAGAVNPQFNYGRYVGFSVRPVSE